MVQFLKVPVNEFLKINNCWNYLIFKMTKRKELKSLNLLWYNLNVNVF